MEQSKKRGRKPKTEKLDSTSSTTQKHGVVEGNYSVSNWNNGELISFNIDWDKLKKIFDEMKKGT